VEQLLRKEPSAAGLDLALQVLQGSVHLVLTAPKQQLPQPQQRQQQQRQRSTLGSRREGAAELQRLAYCSLASSVVQVTMSDEELGGKYACQLLALAGALVRAAEEKGAAQSRSRTATTASSSSSGGGGALSLVLPLAAAAAAGGFFAHVCAASHNVSASGADAAAAADTGTDADTLSDVDSVGEVAGACMDTDTLSDVDSFGAVAGTDTDTLSDVDSVGAVEVTRASGEPDPAPTSSTTPSSTTGAPAADAGSGAAAAVEASAGHLDCEVCLQAMWLLAALFSTEAGNGTPAELWAEVLAEAPQLNNISLQDLLHEQLLALAWRHPVPHVCGNVLCGRLEGAAAVGAVRGRVGSLCGGCRAAWYCCEGCQRVAWAAHRAVCMGGS
jgi:hypothetical protein